MEKINPIQAMSELLEELNAAQNLDIELHPFFKPVAYPADSIDLRFKLHQKGADPDCALDILVNPMNFDSAGHLDESTRAKIEAELASSFGTEVTD